MPEQTPLKQRLDELFSNRGTTVTLRQLLRTVPDIDERKTWRFCFALCRMMSLLIKGTQEYTEGVAYYWAYVQHSRYEDPPDLVLHQEKQKQD